MPLISASGLIKDYGTKKEPIRALGPVDVSIEAGEFVVILGRSGSGKSTLLNLLTGLDRPSDGKLVITGEDLSQANGKQLAKYRTKIGIIFQFYNLLPNLNTLENVMMGAWAAGKKVQEEDAKKLLESFGLGHRLKANIKTLSGGEKQRVAICRSLIGQPEILFCDEPTGALDSGSEDQVKDILLNLNKTSGLTTVMVTHNPDFASLASQIIKMKDGLVEEKTEVLPEQW